ncbi:hypothetical protein Egran_06807 [Elaphomyces granulatus]|uniref:Uncharacterized protein n=1 Tax=Elaphomyces granulatus TaxID=519963 RepID=A0A232LMQ2_9EURO|nr:hypothetical protein Egran_06807 [Elaphomyces granulatus]
MDSRLIQYNVDTRWNSAYRMLDDAWKAATAFVHVHV